ncbi:KGK domain-containing protein [Nostoc sp. UHCC 0870]|uniref:KGK domain-containing protein n=1 Tax=Nostoc sp. UHCC 0870 TaxID=2914041 RepID=UPI001EE1195A|nr:KGK domain-containing protein [Nostoc sp. UHCC 0870]UKO96049.1 KGK domain-containing protein [Nostoc sp. UHCC 0870]
MTDGFEILNHDEVVTIEPDTFNKLDIAKTFKVRDLITAIKEYIGAEDTAEANLYTQGLNCEVLKFTAQGWIKGKVRLALEFCPDEPDSPLDEIYEIHQQLQQIAKESVW